MRHGLPRSAQEFAHGQPRHDAYCFDRELEWRQLLNQLPSVTFDDAIRNVAERLWTKAANASRRPPPARAVANALHGAWRPKVPNILKRPSASRSGRKHATSRGPWCLIGFLRSVGRVARIVAALADRRLARPAA